jgi:hypothetical protein
MITIVSTIIHTMMVIWKLKTVLPVKSHQKKKKKMVQLIRDAIKAIHKNPTSGRGEKAGGEKEDGKEPCVHLGVSLIC